MIRTYRENGFLHLVIENEKIRAVFLPEIGGKMKELINLETGTQFLLENQREDGLYSIPLYGSDFSEYDVSGFDECFPTVSACGKDLNEDKKYCFPDHGELWSREWRFSYGSDFITLSIEGMKTKYLFEKKIKLIEDSIEITYSVRNLSSVAFPYIWSAHPLLQISKGDKLLLPEEIDAVSLHWASDPIVGKPGDLLNLPFLMMEQNEFDFSIVPNKSVDIALKCFTEKLSKGYAGLYKKEKNETILFTFDADEIPYLGIWLCYGGWPNDSTGKHYTIGLEPTNGNSDSLSEAVRKDNYSELRPFEEHNWTLKITLVQGIPEIFYNESDERKISHNLE
jgi:galactose mutarotase-like enzyme